MQLSLSLWPFIFVHGLRSLDFEMNPQLYGVHNYKGPSDLVMGQCGLKAVREMAM